jgi:DGQHR domain-containing protein
MSQDSRREIPALVVHQWLPEWDDVRFSAEDRRRKPEDHFYLFALPAYWLRTLSDVYRRKADKPRAADTGIQRAHVPRRSAEIGRFVHSGFPYSDLSEKQKQVEEYRDLRMPGWLPTAIICNILPPGAKRGNASFDEHDAIQIQKLSDTTAKLLLPSRFGSDDWSPRIAPIEIIDGQHRLLSFEPMDQLDGQFEFPVVAFYDLDVTFQAYLFYTINIRPKRINPSLAYDLYPILRIQDWLEKSPVGPAIYRETRAQELTEILWSHPASPWRGRISMLGESRTGTVTQNAFIRSLTSSYVKRREGGRIGGLFGAELTADSSDVLDWSRPQQAAFLIFVWRSLADAIRASKAAWAEQLRQRGKGGDNSTFDPAFAGTFSLLATDQGVRGVLQLTNDMCYLGAEMLKLNTWEWDEGVDEDTVSEESVSTAMQSVEGQPVADFVRRIATEMARFDWRTSAFPGLSESQRRAQAVFRGSGGYRELRMQLLQLLRSSSDEQIARLAADVWTRLGY